MCSGAGHTTCLVRGSPIRTPSDQRSVGSSPRLIAASHVLHRLLVPRHPPCALNNLTTQQPPTRRAPTPHTRGSRQPRTGGPTNKRTYKQKDLHTKKDARVHCAVLNEQTATGARSTARPRKPPGGTTDPPALSRSHTRPPHRGETGPFPQDPTACLPPPPTPGPVPRTPPGAPYYEPAVAGGRTGQRSTLEHHPGHPAAPPIRRGRPGPGAALDHQGDNPPAASAP